MNPPKIVKEATKEYQEEEDIIGHFIKERCELISGKKVQANSLYESYKTWCEFNGHNPLTGTSFGKRMGDRFEKSYDGRFHYKGITLITDLISP